MSDLHFMVVDFSDLRELIFESDFRTKVSGPFTFEIIQNGEVCGPTNSDTVACWLCDPAACDCVDGGDSGAGWPCNGRGKCIPGFRDTPIIEEVQSRLGGESH